MKCRRCGKEKPEGARYCPYCGEPAAAHLRPGTAVREVTCVSLDVQGFTKLEGAVPRSRITEMRQRCMGVILKHIDYFGGCVVSRSANGVQAAFGAPVTRERDTELAVLAAIEITEGIGRISNAVYAQFGVGFNTRCGIDVGRVKYERLTDKKAVGFSGASMDYADHLKTSARPNETLVSHAAYDYLRDYFDFRPYVLAAAKAFEKPITSYAVRGRKHTTVPVQLLARGPFVARKDELNRLVRGIKKATGGTGTLTIVIGEAGMGKTRVAAEATRAAKASRVFWTRYLPNPGTLPYLPFRQLITEILNVKPAKVAEKAQELDGIKGAALEKHIPLLGQVFNRDFGKPPAEPTAPQEERKRLLFGVVLRIIETAAVKPSVIVFENFHWADEASFELTKFLAPELKKLPVACVITARSARDVTALRPDDVIYLRPLNEDDIETIARRIIPDNRWNDSVREMITGLARGNPLYAEEFARAVSTRAPGKPLEVPAAVRIHVQAQVDRLSDDARTLIKLGSCVGSSFGLHFLRELSALPADNFFAALRELSGEGLIYIGEDEIQFKSPLTPAVVSQELPDGYKAIIHLNIAERLKRSDGAPEVIAKQLVAAGLKDEASRYLIDAGDAKAKTLAYEAALSLYLKAADVTDDQAVMSGDGDSLSSKIVQKYIETGKTDEAVNFLRGKFRYAKTIESKAEFLSLLGKTCYATGEFARSLEYYEDAEKAFRSLGDTKGVATQLVNRGRSYYGLGRRAEALACARSAIDAAASAGDDRGLAEAYRLGALVKLSQNDTAETLEYLEKARKIWAGLNDTEGLLDAYRFTGVLLVGRGYFTKALPYLKKSVELAEKTGSPKARATSLADYALALVYNGRVNEAIDLLEKGVPPAADETAFREARAAAYSALSFARYAARDFEEAARAAETALGCAEPPDVPGRVYQALILLAKAKLAAGRKDIAGELRRLEELAKTNRLEGNVIPTAVWQFRARLSILDGDEKGARQATAKAGYYTRTRPDVAAHYEQGLLDGELQEAFRARDPARKKYLQVYEMAGKSGAMYYRAEAAVRLARSFLNEGDTRNASIYVRTLEKVFGGQGLKNWKTTISDIKNGLKGA